jgi:hypothetical protein
MPDHVTCPRCGCAARVGPHHSAHCVQCFTSFRTDVACPRCGQLGRADVCTTCRDADRQPQGEAMRLFTPAPTQIPGQFAF